MGTADISEAVIRNPCARNCCLDCDEICLGCGRLLSEILRWGQLSKAERVQILLRIHSDSAAYE